MKTRNLKLLSLIAVQLILLACTFSFGGLSQAERLQTAVAETVTAQAQADAQQISQQEQAQPTDTPAPEDTEAPPPTATPEPCNKAQFISETVPDGTKFTVGEDFVKSWRLKNVGTCTWNTGYELAFYEGDQMGGPADVNLTQSVAPGEQIDLAVNLTAPSPAGTYKGFWRVKDDEGDYFVFNLWVEIESEPLIVVPPIVLKPDLVVTYFDINPSTPTQGANTHVTVRVKNNGVANAGAFKVQWYGLDTFTNPSCTWNVASLGGGDQQQLECDFVFASWYPVNKTTIVIVDTADAVDESNEGNNTKTISPFGVNP